MRDVVLYHLLSVDGVAEEPGDWFADGSPEVFANLGRVIGTQTDVLLGRHTYEYWRQHWPASDLEPFAPFINSTPKHVFTSSPLDGDWANAAAVTTRAADHVRRLQADGDGDIGVHGSTILARSLLREDLVDRLELVVAPTLAGHGARLFDADGPSRRLELLDVRRSPAGTTFLSYRRAPDQS